MVIWFAGIKIQLGKFFLDPSALENEGVTSRTSGNRDPSTRRHIAEELGPHVAAIIGAVPSCAFSGKGLYTVDVTYNGRRQFLIYRRVGTVFAQEQCLQSLSSRLIYDSP